ncbi:MAG: HAD-IIB family hydrolase [Patescibacteria group bacterium]
MNDIKMIACDLDGTLAPSKAPLEKSMAETMCLVLKKHRMAVISGGSFAQYQKQFLQNFTRDTNILKNLYLFPTNGSRCYVFDETAHDWKSIYEENLTDEEKKKIVSALGMAIQESKIDVSDPYGELIEDRGSQISFSGRGQEAPLDVKKIWDPDKTKRQAVVAILERYIPEFEMRINANSTIDITHKGIDKAYAIRKMEKLLNLTAHDIVFIGDAIFVGGNDWAAKEAGVECIPVSGPEETEEILKRYAQ